MLEQNVDCTIVEEGDEEACIMKSVIIPFKEWNQWVRRF